MEHKIEKHLRLKWTQNRLVPILFYPFYSKLKIKQLVLLTKGNGINGNYEIFFIILYNPRKENFRLLIWLGQSVSPKLTHLLNSWKKRTRLTNRFQVNNRINQFYEFWFKALGDVISALCTEASFVPYRNNKLTELMQDSLGGNAKVNTALNQINQPLVVFFDSPHWFVQ